MDILVVNGDYLGTNSSANLCHLAYIRGLLAAGHRVTLLSADGRDHTTDSSLRIPDEVEQHTYYSVSLYEKLARRKRQGNAETASPSGTQKTSAGTGVRTKLIRSAKKAVLSSYGPHGIYAKFVSKARHFSTDKSFDYIISLSTPPSSHRLAYILIKTGRVHAGRWIQIWEDPWYSDAYGFNGKKSIFREEKRLLSVAERVCYVSPLTLKNQQKLFPESAGKMYWQPLPFYYTQEGRPTTPGDRNVYGYFGEYQPQARDLRPFYDAAKDAGIEVNICGNPSTLFTPTDTIHIHSRLPLEELKPIEDRTNVLVFLCNRGGGQIPGKIYQYSATNKTILFILDGTEEEKSVIRDYFEPFHRYVFCENKTEDIRDAIRRIERGDLDGIANEPVARFEPAETIRRILEGD